ncbi:MAG: HIT domain-containing protein [Candidatus Micrarchaeaceae archaeon]
MAAKEKLQAAKDPFCDSNIVGRQLGFSGRYFACIYDSIARTDGHLLLITKEHRAGLLDLTAQEAGELFGMMNKSVKASMDLWNGGENAYCLMIRSGGASGRTVDHFHIHIIPRKRVGMKDGRPAYDNIYEKTLQGAERPFLASIEEEVKMLRRGFEGARPAISEVTGNSGKFAALDPGLAGNVFYESESWSAVYNPKPIIEGQTLLIPKRDISDISQLSREEAEDLARTYAKVMTILLKMYGDESRSYITSMQTGGYVSMPLDRMHIHLIVRRNVDRYTGAGDHIYYDLYENGIRPKVMTEDEIREDVAALRRLV